MLGKYKLILLATILLVLPLATSQLIFSQNSAPNISIACSWNNTECSSGASCNYSVFSPSSIRIKNASTDVNAYSFFNVTLNSSQTNELGEYLIDMFCYEQNIGEAEVIEFKITPSGKELSTSQGIVYIFFLIIVFFIFFALLYGAFKIPWKNVRNDEGKIVSINDLKWIKLSCITFSYLTLVFITSLTYTLTDSYLFLPGASAFFNAIHRVLYAFMFPFFILMPWIVLFMVIADKNTKKFIERGLPMR